VIPRHTIAEILETARIEEVISEYVPLKKKGANFMGLCPFHNEKTPSFSVSPSKGIFKCFGCGKSGNVVGFLMEHEHFTYPEALRFLAEKYQIAIEEAPETDEEKARRQKEDSLFIINQFALRFYQEELFSSEPGMDIGLAYLKERGFRLETIRKFQIGYAPAGPDHLAKAAMEQGYRLEMLKELGLVTEQNNRKQDFFRERIIFPILNLSGKPVAFAGRIMEEHARGPKYINSPETPIYQKSKVLYGLFHARQAIRKEENCLMVEGYTDVMTLHQNGIENVVASSGTSLTQDQVRLLSRFTKTITILYDGDEAGIAAALRGVDIILEQGLQVFICVLPEPHDPDSFIRETGKDGFLDYLDKHAEDFILFKTGQALKDVRPGPAGKAEVIREIVSSIALIPDPIQRPLYVKECARMVELDEQLLMQELNKTRRKRLQQKGQLSRQQSRDLEKKESRSQPATPQTAGTDQEYLLERSILSLLLRYGNREYTKEYSVAGSVLMDLQDSVFKELLHQKLLEEIREQFREGKIPEEQYFLHHADPDISRLSIELVTDKYAISKNWKKRHEIFVPDLDDQYRQEVHSVMYRYNLLRVLKLIEENREAMRSAGSEEELLELQKRRKELLEMKKTLGQKLNAVILNKPR